MLVAQAHILSESRLYYQIERDLFGLGRSRQPDRVGLEAELFALRASDGTMRQVTLTGKDGLLAWLERIATTHGWRMERDEFDNAVLDLPEGGRITLEPAGQIEYSTSTVATPSEALADLNRVVDILEEEARPWGIELVVAGYNSICPEDLLVLQVSKPRYRFMDQHFARIGEFGRKMMRATCAMQINLDFGPPAIASERWRLANMIAPSLNAIFANSPHTHDGHSYRSFRYEIWRRTDPTRTGRLYDRPDLDPIADYLRFALDATVMLICDGPDACAPPPHPMTFRQWMAGVSGVRRPTLADWHLHLTTLFPDVRPKGWMELRSIDCLPRRWWPVPVALATTLLYDDTIRRHALERLELCERRIDPNEHEHGGAWRADFETGGELMEMALPAIRDAELARVADEYMNRFLRRGITPAEHP